MISLVDLRRASLGLLWLAALCAPRAARAEDACKASFEAAQERRLEGKPTRARAELRRCKSACPEVFAKQCDTWLAEVEPTIARVSVVVVDADQRVRDGAAITVDGAPLAAADAVVALELDPGPHTIAASAPEAGRGSVTVTLASGESRAVRIALLREEAQAPASTGATWPFKLLLGAGGALAVGGAVTVGVGHANRASYEASCPCEEAVALARRDEVRTLWIAGGVTAGIGVLAAGVGLLGLTWSSSEPASGVAVTLTPGLGSFAVRAQF